MSLWTRSLARMNNFALRSLSNGFRVPKESELKEVWVYKKMLQAAIDRKLRVFTSSLTTVECTSIEGDSTSQVQEAFSKLFSAGNLIVPVQPTHAVRELATALKWRHGINLSPMDSIQVASALI